MHKELQQVCESMKLSMKKLTNFQVTTFGNIVRFVFIDLRDGYLAVKQNLHNLISVKEKPSDAESRKKAAEAKEVFRTIKFLDILFINIPMR